MLSGAQKTGTCVDDLGFRLLGTRRSMLETLYRQAFTEWTREGRSDVRPAARMVPAPAD